MWQRISIIGNLGGEVSMRYTQDGTPVSSFNVATNKRWTGADGEKHEQTTWFRCTAWRKLAETCNQYLKKGSRVFIEGELEPDKESGGPRIWSGDDGNSRASYELTAHNVKFLDSKNEGE